MKTQDTFEEIVSAIYSAEELTETLIAELSAKGWSEQRLREMAAEGFSYNRNRDSFFGPPQYFGFDQN